MNNVQLRGTVVSRRDKAGNGRTPQVRLDLYIRDIRQTVTAIVCGNMGVQALPKGVAQGVEVEVFGRLNTLHWRQPRTGIEGREVVVEVRRLALIKPVESNTGRQPQSEEAALVEVSG